MIFAQKETLSINSLILNTIVSVKLGAVVNGEKDKAAQ